MAASFFKIALSPALHRCFQPRKFAVGHGHVLTVRDRLHVVITLYTFAVRLRTVAAGRSQSISLASFDVSRRFHPSFWVLQQGQSEAPASRICLNTTTWSLCKDWRQVCHSAAQAAIVPLLFWLELLASFACTVSELYLTQGVAAGWCFWMHLRCCSVRTLDSKMCALQPLRGKIPPFFSLSCVPCWIYYS